jgi:riboflavin synthase
MKYILPKGSIAVDGISLTVVNNKSHTFTVYIIPHTANNTTLGFKGPSDKVNIEFDILAKKAIPT